MRCNYCQSNDFRYSAFKPEDFFLLLVLIRPFRCKECEERTYRFVGALVLSQIARRLGLDDYFSRAMDLAQQQAIKFREFTTWRSSPPRLQERAIMPAFSPSEDDEATMDDSLSN